MLVSLFNVSRTFQSWKLLLRRSVGCIALWRGRSENLSEGIAVFGELPIHFRTILIYSPFFCLPDFGTIIWHTILTVCRSVKKNVYVNYFSAWFLGNGDQIAMSTVTSRVSLHNSCDRGNFSSSSSMNETKNAVSPPGPFFNGLSTPKSMVKWQKSLLASFARKCHFFCQYGQYLKTILAF